MHNISTSKKATQYNKSYSTYTQRRSKEIVKTIIFTKVEPSNMIDGRTIDSPDPPINNDGVETAQPETRFTTDALYMRLLQQSTKTVLLAYMHTGYSTRENKKSKIDPTLVHKRIVDVIRAIIVDTAAIITSNNQITHSKNIPSGAEYEQMFPDIRTDHMTKHIYLSFTLESTHTVSQLKYGSKYDGITGIFDTLRENLAFIKIQTFHSLTEASIRFFLGINPKLTLRNVLKKKIDEIFTWLDLDDEDTKELTETNPDENGTTSQEIVIPAYDIYHKVFGSGTGNDRY